MTPQTLSNKKGKPMSGTVRARMHRGFLELLEKVNVPEGREVSVTIIDTLGTDDVEAFERAAGSWKGTVDAEALIEQIYEDRARPSNRPIPRL